MAQRRPRILFAGIAALLLTLSGCALKRTSGVYQLKQIESQYFLLPPNTSDSTEKYQKLSIPLAQMGGHRQTSDNVACSIKGAWFSFYRVPGSKFWTAEVPAATAWERSGGTVDMKDEWQAFEADLYGLLHRRCFSSLDEYSLAKQRIATNLPAPASDALFYRYGYGPGGYVDLAPGMQLRIERDLYAAEDSEQPRPEDYRGTTITSYGIAPSGEDEVKLVFLRIDKRSPPADALHAIVPSPNLDANLVSQFSASSRLRLFLQDLVVSGNAKTPAILIGASSEIDLKAVTAEIETKPQVSCTDLVRWRVTCAIFHGAVTVSPMLQVTVNGAQSYIPIGSKLWFVLPLVQGAKDAKLVRTLRVQRLYLGKMTDVRFAHNQEEISQLLLVGGDRISWSRSIGAR
jgi:hypothetical protein